MKLFNLSKKKMLGQGMTEYIIIVALIAIAAIGVFAAFGDVVKNQVSAMAQELSGTTGSAGKAGATAAGAKADEKAARKNDLKSFTGGQN